MPDYGHPITFGLSLYPSLDQLSETRQLAQEADAAGLDYLAIQDHAYNPEFLDVWTLIAYLAAETDRISLFPDVADLQLRPPTILAKAAASLSVLNGGRIILGVGGGASAGGIAAMGGTRRSGREMVAFTEEALRIMRQALAGGIVEFQSGQHAIEGYEAGPLPPSPVPLWLGSNGPTMLAVTGRSSDGWVSPLSTYVGPTAVPSRQQLIDDAARSAGRDPAEVRRIYNVVGMIGPKGGGPGLTGDVSTWVDTLTEWSVGLGFDTFIYWPMDEPLAQLTIFAEEVAPAVRQRVSDRRADPRPPLRDDGSTMDQPHQNAALGIEPIQTIGRDELKAKIDRGADFKLIMALNRWAFEAKHIPGSVHFDTPDALYGAVRPDDEVVVYCSNVDCLSSVALYRDLVRRGYRNVRRYSGGLLDWEDAGLPLEGEFAGSPP